MTTDNKANLENEVKFLIEHYTGCEYKTLLNYSGYIKGLLIATDDNCLKGINSKNLIGKEFCDIYKDITYKKEEINGLTEKCIKIKKLITDMYCELTSKNEDIELLKQIDLYFEMLFEYETLWSLEFVKEDNITLNKEQEDIFVYLSHLARMYINLTDNIIKKCNYNNKTKVLMK